MSWLLLVLSLWLQDIVRSIEKALFWACFFP